MAETKHQAVRRHLSKSGPLVVRKAYHPIKPMNAIRFTAN